MFQKDVNVSKYNNLNCYVFIYNKLKFVVKVRRLSNNTACTSRIPGVACIGKILSIHICQMVRESLNSSLVRRHGVWIWDHTTNTT